MGVKQGQLFTDEVMARNMLVTYGRRDFRADFLNFYHRVRITTSVLNVGKIINRSLRECCKLMNIIAIFYFTAFRAGAGPVQSAYAGARTRDRSPLLPARTKMRHTGQQRHKRAFNPFLIHARIPQQ